MSTDGKCEFLNMYLYLKEHPVIKVEFEHAAQELWDAMQIAESLEEYFRLDRERCQILLDRWAEFQRDTSG